VRSVRNQWEQTHRLLCHKTRAGGHKRRALGDLLPAVPIPQESCGVAQPTIVHGNPCLRSYWGCGVHKPFAQFEAMAMPYGRLARLPLPQPHAN
jgi:hypothetical protein